MTVITVNTTAGRLSLEQRRTLAQTLTDAVLIPEIGQFVELARVGFQVHFVERATDMIAIGGVLAADSGQDIMHIDIAVMDADWNPKVRAEVIERILAAMAEACGTDAPAPTWWVNFRTIDEGSWGSSGGVTSIQDMLTTGVFTPERVAAIRAALL